MNEEMLLIPDAASDEKEKDPRDWVGDITTYFSLKELPDEFTIDDGIYNSQDKDGYKMSCGAQGTINAVNGAKKAKADYEPNSQEALRDLAIKNKIAGDWGSYLIDIIRLAQEENIITGYYQTDALLDILNAIYKTDLVVTGSNQINWYDSRDGFVKKIEKGTGHAFCIIGWDKTKEIGDYTGALKCKNSYGKKEFDNGCFWIPFILCNKILFNTKKALIVTPLWAKLSIKQRKYIYLKLKEKYDDTAKYSRKIP